MNNNKWKEIYEQSLFWKHKETGQVVKVGRVSNWSVEWHEEDGRPNGTTYDLFLSEFIPLNQNSMEVILFEKNFQKLLKKFEEKEKELEIANSILKKKEFIYHRDFMGPYIKINGEDEYIIIYMNETQEEYIENHIKELKEED